VRISAHIKEGIWSDQTDATAHAPGIRRDEDASDSPLRGALPRFALSRAKGTPGAQGGRRRRPKISQPRILFSNCFDTRNFLDEADGPRFLDS
jgi:hypothetical protein